jgi:hypothetical protein
VAQVTLDSTHTASGFVLIPTTTPVLATGTGTNYYRYGTSSAALPATLTALALITIDNTAPSVVSTLDLPASEDRGISSTDNITSKATELCISGVTAADAKYVNVFAEYDPAGGTSYGAQFLLGSTYVIAGNGAFNFATGSTALADGKYRIRAKSVDAAGNESAFNTSSVDLIITIDTTALSAPTMTVADADMSFNQSGVRITKLPNNVTLSGTGQAAAALAVFNDLNNNGSQDAGESTLTLYTPNTATPVANPVISAGSTFSYDLVYLTDGLFNLRAVTTDTSGNSSVSLSPVNFTLDRSSNPAQALALLTDRQLTGNDSGVSAYDSVTQSTTPRFRITLPRDAEVGDKVELTRYTTYDASYLIAQGTLASGDITAGYIDLTSSTLAAATYSGGTAITAWFTDRAGNRSTGVSLSSLVIDQTAPSAGTTINLLNADDTGVSATDNIIRYGTNFSVGNTSGLASDAVQVGVYDVFNSIETLLGYASINASRLWNFTYTGTALADGTHSLGIKTTDAAGNTSALSTTRLTLGIDCAHWFPDLRHRHRKLSNRRPHAKHAACDRRHRRAQREDRGLSR